MRRKYVGLWFAMVGDKIVLGTPKQIEAYRVKHAN
jgi:hypothetical protein